MNKRKKLIEWLFDKSQKVYTSLFKRNAPWNITKSKLLTYPKSSFGNHLGLFLDNNNFELIAKVERHDAYHTLTGYGINAQDEIALQYLCYGNGKRSLYGFGVIMLGTFILPEYYKYYYKSYIIGKNANPFHQYDYKKLLTVSIDDFRAAIFSKHQIKHITQLQ